MRRYVPAVLSLVAGLLLGGLVLIWAGPPASAFVPPTTGSAPYTDGIDRAERLKVFKEVLQKSESPNPVTKSASRRILTRAIGKVAGSRLMPVMGRAGLVGAAAGSWAVVAYELKYAIAAGEESVVKTRLNVAPAPGSLVVGGVNSNLPNVESAESFLTKVHWKVFNDAQSAKSFTLDLTSRSYVSNWYNYTRYSGDCHWQAQSGDIGFHNQYEQVSRVFNYSEFRPCGSAPDYQQQKTTTTTARFADVGTGPFHISGTHYPPPSNSASRHVDKGGQLCTLLGCEFTRYLPTFQTGPSAPVETLPAVDYTSQGQEADRIVDAVVADPEAPTVIPELPDPDDPFWTDPDAPQDPDPDPVYDPSSEPKDPDDPLPAPPADSPQHDPTSPNSDPDEDGIPNETDPDDDNDGVPDEGDTNPYAPDPPPDADQDGDPDQSDPDDDNDGIPDTDDPEPKTPTNPATLPRDHPYADPDEDGTPNKDDPDNDGDGTPDTEDPEPNNPEVGAPDLDKDGIPDKSDGDQDGDDVPDWEDVERRTQAVPNQTPDGDDDGVPDWSDPWPGNPYAPADPTKDGDSDDVPDYKDPEPAQPNVPMSPWPSGSPGDVPSNPGEPNMPANPTNPNHPPSSSTPAEPTDPSSPLDPNAPINPSAPENPGEPGGPPGEGDGCPVARQSAFKLPTIEVASVFPFNLVVWCYGAVASLHEPPSAPEWEVPFLGTMNLSTQEGLFGAVRTVLTSLILIALVMGWYSYIKGSEA